MILVRRDGKTVISMANDYRGALTEFALVVPVPQVLERDQIHIGERTAVRAHRRVQRAAARRVLRPRPVRGDETAQSMGGVDAARPASVAKEVAAEATRRSASPSRRPTRSASTTS